METVICSECGKTFEQNEKVNTNLANAVGRSEKEVCYSCALKSLTGGRVPEEGDFNSASLISGEISDKELAWLQEDLRAVEQGCSIREPYDETDENIGSIWDEHCPKCYEPLEACQCGYVKRCEHCHEPLFSCCCDPNENEGFVADEEEEPGEIKGDLLEQLKYLRDS